MSDLDVERQNIGDREDREDMIREEPVNNRLKVIDNNESESIEHVKRIEDLYKNHFIK